MDQGKTFLCLPAEYCHTSVFHSSQLDRQGLYEQCSAVEETVYRADFDFQQEHPSLWVPFQLFL